MFFFFFLFNNCDSKILKNSRKGKNPNLRVSGMLGAVFGNHLMATLAFWDRIGPLGIRKTSGEQQNPIPTCTGAVNILIFPKNIKK